jgi:hypothetical protein
MVNKEVLYAAGFVALAAVVVLAVRDNLPSGSFSFKKKA